jgi:Sigma-70, region 4.
MPQAGNVYSVSPEVQRQVVDLYASIGSYAEVGRRLGISLETARRIVKSPQGSFALEQLLRERARTRALRLGALTDRAIDEMDTCLTNGNERILNSRRDGDPITVFLRPDIKDLTGALAWMTHHMREVSETLSAIDVTNHDVSHEARSQNLTTLKELVALEERRLLLDAERQAADAPPVDVADDASPWSRPRWGALSATPHRRVASTDDGDTREPVSSITAPDTEAALMHAPARDGSHNQPCPPTQAREAANETERALGSSAASETSSGVRDSNRSSSSEVSWDDLEED